MEGQNWVSAPITFKASEGEGPDGSVIFIALTKNEAILLIQSLHESFCQNLHSKLADIHVSVTTTTAAAATSTNAGNEKTGGWGVKSNEIQCQLQLISPTLYAF